MLYNNNESQNVTNMVESPKDILVFHKDKLTIIISCEPPHEKAGLLPMRKKDARLISAFVFASRTSRIQHGWSVEIRKSQTEGPSVPMGN